MHVKVGEALVFGAFIRLAQNHGMVGVSSSADAPFHVSSRMGPLA